MDSTPGTYLLILRCRRRGVVQIGRWREIHVVPGYYLYAGSAFGPGGVRARIARHFRTTKRRHWHIDYLRDVAEPTAAWYTHATERCEHRWAQLLGDTAGMIAIPGFGCSDCRCRTHLYRSPAEPDFKRFCRAAGGGVARLDAGKERLD
jgi:Uri superfamily endonuclease